MNRNPLVVSLSWTLLFLAGAALPELTPGGRAVQTMTPDVVGACEPLGPASSWKPGSEGGQQAADVDIRNRIAARGGNAIVVRIVNVEHPKEDAEIIAESYRCGALTHQPGQLPG